MLLYFTYFSWFSRGDERNVPYCVKKLGTFPGLEHGVFYLVIMLKFFALFWETLPFPLVQHSYVIQTVKGNLSFKYAYSLTKWGMLCLRYFGFWRLRFLGIQTEGRCWASRRCILSVMSFTSERKIFWIAVQQTLLTCFFLLTNITVL